jgi:hypothetical protein
MELALWSAAMLIQAEGSARLLSYEKRKGSPAPITGGDQWPTHRTVQAAHCSAGVTRSGIDRAECNMFTPVRNPRVRLAIGAGSVWRSSGSLLMFKPGYQQGCLVRYSPRLLNSPVGSLGTGKTRNIHSPAFTETRVG